MKKHLLLIILTVCGWAFGQNYPMNSSNNGQTFTTCSGTFTDDGGNSNYSSNVTNRTITFCPANATDLLKFHFTSFNTENGFDELEVFYGTDTTGTPNEVLTGNLGSFDIITALPGDCITFRFNSDSSLNYSGWSATISCVTPCSPPTAVLVDDSDVEICSSEAVNPGDLTVDFDASASYSNDSFSVVIYEWNWGDGTTSVTGTPTTSHTFPDEPGYYVVSLKVRTNNYATDEGGCISGNTAVRYVKVLPPPNFEGTTEGTIEISCGDYVDLTGIASSQTITQDPPPGNGSDVALPDNQNQPFDSTIDLTGYFPAGATISDGCFPEITFNIEHSFVGDLKIFLIAPSGEQIILLDGNGDGNGAANNMGGDFLGYCVNDTNNGPGCPAPYHVVNSGGYTWDTPPTYTNYTQPCNEWSACDQPFGGSYYLQDATYNSSDPMSGLVGAELNGIWTLRVVDYWAADDGYMDGWSISFPNACYSNLETETPILSGGEWSSDGTGPAVPEPQVITNDPFVPTTIDPCPDGADCTGNILQNSTTVGPFVNSGTYTYTFTVTDEFGCIFEKEVTIVVDCPCSLDLTSAPSTTDQTVCMGQAIEDITYEAGGNATDVDVTGLPAGVTYDFTGGILTISGSPTETGTFNYSVTTIGCEFNITLEGTITVGEGPEVTELPDPFEFCTASTTTYNYDLTQVEPLLVATPADYNFTYYTSQADAEVPQNNIATPDSYPVSATAPTVIWIRVEEVGTGCSTITSITVQPGEPYDLTPLDEPIQVCDDDFDGNYIYDLTDLDDVVSPGSGYTLNYFETQTDAINNNPIPTTEWTDYEFSGMPNSVWVVAMNADECRSNPLEIEFVEGEKVSVLGGPYEIPFCDGQGVDLTDYESTFTSETGVTFAYFESLSNAQNNVSAITNENNYVPDSVGATIYVRLESADKCPEIIVVEFVEGQGISMLNGPYEIPFCDGQPIDLTDFEDIYTSETGVTYSYHNTLLNAQNDANPITNYTNYTPASIGSVIYVRLEKLDRCAEIAEVEFIAGDEVVHNGGPFGPILYCEDQTIDITQYESDITTDPDVTFNYYLTQNEAQTGTGSEITNTSDFAPGEDSGSVFIRLESNDGCPAVVEIPYEQRPAPSLVVDNDNTLCEGDEIEITATSDFPDATFEWTDESGNVLEGETQTFTETGTYSVVAIGGNGCESIPQTVTIAPPSPPAITNVESGDGYIIVYAANNGGGPMEYSLDGILWQSSNQFNNLVNGQTYTVYVRSDGCVKTSYTITILDVPNFVSPNGDGYNDEWTIRGIEVTPDATIKIFDRYGKVFVDTNFDGDYVWDGKYNGGPLPSGDYWYILNVPGDGVIVPQKYVGHVSIRN